MALIGGENLNDALFRRVDASPGRFAQLRKVGGEWSGVSWSDIEAEVFATARALAGEGVVAGDRVAIISQTRPEWATADLAILSLGAITVPVYPSVTADDINFIFQDAGVTFVFVENSIHREKVEALRGRLPGLKGIVSFEAPTQASGAKDFPAWCRAARAAVDNEPIERQAWRERARGLKGDTIATIVYTSGTESAPKGVALTHQNFMAVMGSVADRMRVGEQDVTLLFLPVAHVMGRVEQMMSIGVGWTNAYSPAHSSLMDNLLEVKPTILFGVPQVFERIRQGLLRQVRIPVKWAPFREATQDLVVNAGYRYSLAMRSGRGNWWKSIGRWALDRLFYERVRALFGGRLRFAVSGGAPLGRDVPEFFHACGLSILEGYGLTESTGPVSLNVPDMVRFGSVGKMLPDAELRFAEDGEILLRGPMLFAGYWESSELKPVDANAWFPTGDIGRLDSEGYLYITDRKKDIVVTAGGKNIAPFKIESRFKSIPILSHVLIAGDRKNYVTALFTLNVEQARTFSEARKIPFRGVADLVEDERFQRHFRDIVEGVNRKLAPFETIRRYRVLPRDFSIEAGELTPSLKVKRSFCLRKYAEQIEEMYR